MNLFVIGDHNYGDPDVFSMVGGYLDDIHYGINEIDNLITFDEDGVDYLSTIWAYEEKVPFKMEGRPTCKEAMANSWFRKIVDDNKIDAFLFIFLPDNQPLKGQRHRHAVRDLFRRVQKTFKRQKVYTNELSP